MTSVTVLPDAQAAVEYAAQELARNLREALDRRGVAHFALAGGNTPRPAYELLAGLIDDWGAIELWYGDERCVQPDDPESNHRLVMESLLTPIADSGRAGPLEHRVRGELDPQTAAAEYAEELRSRVAPAERDGLPALDVALLGIGEDGHTASLFPGHPEVEDSSGALCLPVRDSPKPPPERVTLSLPMLRAARRTLLLVTGAAKAEALAAALAEPRTLADSGMRAQRVSPESVEGECSPASAKTEMRAEGERLPASGDPHQRMPAGLLASERLHVVADADAAARIDPSDCSTQGEATAR